MHRWCPSLRRVDPGSFSCSGAVSARAEAQITAGIATMADILAAPLTGVGTRALQFGVIVPGTTSVTVLPRRAVRRRVPHRRRAATGSRSTSASRCRPSSTGPAGATIPLSFNGNYAGALRDRYGRGLRRSRRYFTWNPVTTPDLSMTSPTRYKPGRKVYTYDAYQVYLGGAASPSSDAAHRAPYTASIGVLLVVN